MRSQLSYPVVALVLLGAACADRSDPAEPTKAPGSPIDAAGAQIERTDFPFGFLGSDPQASLSFFVGPLDPVAAVTIKCPDADVIAPVSPGARAQVVTTPSGEVQIHGITREAHIAVWQFAGVVSSYCDLVGAPVVATGIVHYTVTVTNADAPNGPGSFTWHINAVGLVDHASAGQARLHATARIVVRSDGSLLFDEERISLTPLE